MTPALASILVTGASGMLGHKVCEVLSSKHAVSGTIRSPFAKTPPWIRRAELVSGFSANQPDRIEKAFSSKHYDAVVNCIGVVKQATAAKDPVEALEINAVLPHRLARLCRQAGTRLIQISTDCVFTGAKGGYVEGDAPDATDLYGRSKLLGEVEGPNAVTLRTSIIGRELRGQQGLVEWFLAQRGRKAKGFRRAVFSGLTTAALAGTIQRVLEASTVLEGLYQVSAEPINKYDLLNQLNSYLGNPVALQPDDELVIDRSLNSSRFQAALGWKPPAWKQMLRELADEVPAYDGWRTP